MPRAITARSPRARAPEPVAVKRPEADSPTVVKRADGYWWKTPDGLRLVGPFRSRAEALFDRDDKVDELLDFLQDDDDFVEDLRLAEDELGVPDWVDPETGMLADECWTRTEQH